jgi:hypothetical protein
MLEDLSKREIVELDVWASLNAIAIEDVACRCELPERHAQLVPLLRTRPTHIVKPLDERSLQLIGELVDRFLVLNLDPFAKHR